eukprot:COSAG02_NODE_3845_length_6153_cov_3.206640_8_plen_61_part_01
MTNGRRSCAEDGNLIMPQPPRLYMPQPSINVRSRNGPLCTRGRREERLQVEIIRTVLVDIH